MINWSNPLHHHFTIGVKVATFLRAQKVSLNLPAILEKQNLLQLSFVIQVSWNHPQKKFVDVTHLETQNIHFKMVVSVGWPQKVFEVFEVINGWSTYPPLTYPPPNN